MRLVAVLIMAVLAGCGGNERRQTIVTDKGKAEITTRDDGQATTMNFTGSQGEQASITAGDGARWPSDWPDFAPAYPGAKVLSSMAANGKDGKGGMVSFTTGDSAEKVIAFYRAQAQSAGIGTVATAEAGGSRQFSASDEARGRSLNVSATSEGGATQVALLAGMKR